MANNESIVAYFGGDTSGLQRAIGNATGQIRKFADGMEHKVLGMRHLTSAVATALGLNFEKIAENVARFVTGMSKETEEAYKNLGKLSDELTKKTIEAGTDRLSDEQKYQLALVNTAQLQKKIAENVGKTVQDQVRLTEDKIALLDKEKEAARILAKIQKDAADEDAEAWKNRVHIIEQVAKIKEDDAKKEKDRLKDIGEEDVKWYRERVSLEEKLHEQKLAGMKDEERIVALSKDIADLKKQQKGHDKDTNEYMTLAVEIGGKTKDIDEARKNIAEKIVAAKEAEVAAARAAAVEAAKQLKQYQEMLHIGAIKGERMNDASDATLQDIIRRNKEELFKINVEDVKSNPGGGPSTGRFQDRMRISQEILNAQREIDFRRNLRADYALGGEAMARQNFQGDPLKFDQVLAQIVKGQTTDEKTLATLNKFEELFRRGVPVVFNGGNT